MDGFIFFSQTPQRFHASVTQKADISVCETVADLVQEPIPFSACLFCEAPMLHSETLSTAVTPPVNVVSLENVLAAYDPAFQTAVREALLWEGFELTGGGLPNLQLAREILVSIGWLAQSGYGRSWESFRQFLEWANHQGVLVNLGFEPALAMGD
jgi:hypothetical protein